MTDKKRTQLSLLLPIVSKSTDCVSDKYRDSGPKVGSVEAADKRYIQIKQSLKDKGLVKAR